MLFLTHRTNICPVPQMNIGGTTVNLITGERTPNAKPERMTLHWTLNDVSPNAGCEDEFHAVLDSDFYSKHLATYIVIEPIATMKEKILGGSVDDLYMVGPHSLSSKSILIAPETEQEIIRSTGFTGKIIGYDPLTSNAEKMFSNYVNDHEASLQIGVYFPLTSELERCSELFGNELSKRLISLPTDTVVNTTFYKDCGGQTELAIFKDRTGYFITTLEKDLKLCHVLSIQSHVSSKQIPAQEFVFFRTPSTTAIKLTDLFPNSFNWIGHCHEITPFRIIEADLLNLSFFSAARNLKKIKDCLRSNPVSLAKVFDFQMAIEKAYGLSFEITKIHSYTVKETSNNFLKTPTQLSKTITSIDDKAFAGCAQLTTSLLPK